MVLELPPAPAALVLAGLALAALSCLSAAARLLMTVFGPPGGEDARAPVATPGELTGELGRGELYVQLLVYCFIIHPCRYS